MRVSSLEVGRAFALMQGARRKPRVSRSWLTGRCACRQLPVPANFFAEWSVMPGIL